MADWTDNVWWIQPEEDDLHDIIPVPEEEGTFIDGYCTNITYKVYKDADNGDLRVYMNVENDDRTEKHTILLYTITGECPYGVILDRLVRDQDKNLAKFAMYYMEQTGLIQDDEDEDEDEE